MPYEFRNDRARQSKPRKFSSLLFFILFSLAIFFIGYTLATIEMAYAYPYSYYQPFTTYYTQYDYGYYDNGYYERAASSYYNNFYYYDYDTRPTTYEYWEFTIDWDDSDNYSTSTGLPIIENWSYNVYVEPIPQYSDYWVDTFIYGNYPY